MWRLLRRFVFLLPAEMAHRLGLYWLAGVAWLWRKKRTPPTLPHKRGVSTLGLAFAHPIGLAAGLDKGDVVPEAFFAMGFAFMEIGTVTPRPQAGNPMPRLFRVPRHGALINRMGFNNPGMAVVAERLARVRHRPGPLWLNIAKNKDTPNADAASDYALALRALYAHADAFVVNISSPNTPQLRDLQSEDKLEPLIAAVIAEGRERARVLGVAERPVLLKLSPDLADDALPRIVDIAIAAGMKGLIATNTTLARPVDDPVCAETGGFSGPALMARATAVLALLRERAAGKITLVGVGGIQTAADVETKLQAGAALVEVYSSFVYGGPGYLKQLLGGLRAQGAN